ncbi:MAG TPA: DNA repair protein RadC [Chitinophagales bacterium]|nr:DNA repair protein RadC [Chitinophagales bacterium]
MEEYKNRLTIKTWAEDDRPREKFIGKGKSSLSSAELIAILISSGSREESAVDLAKRILSSVNNDLNTLAKLSVKELCQFKGMGHAKAISILAALELGARRQQSEALSKDHITDSGSMYQILKPRMADLPHEEFWVVYLNRANKIISIEPVSKGGVTGTVADVKIIFKKAIELLASSIILAHNHPSGNLNPSKSDIDLTKKMKETGNIMEVDVLDHIIVTESSYYSFADEGMM